MPSAVLTEGIEPMGIGEGPYEGKPNPHAWVSFTDALAYVHNSATRSPRPTRRTPGTYVANADAYKERIRAAREPVQAMIDIILPERRWLETSEGAFSYLARGPRAPRALPLADQCRPPGDAPAGPQGHRGDPRARYPRDLLGEHGLGQARPPGRARDFDPQHARAVGLPTGLLHYGLLAVISLVVVGALDAVGLILAIALLIAPGATAHLLTERFDRMLAVSIATAVLAAAGGILLGFHADADPAASIVVVLTGLFALTFLLAPKHGILRRRRRPV